MNQLVILNEGLRLRSANSGQLAITIGNFDGLHRAHRVLADRAKQWADRLGIASAALTFDPPPSSLIDTSGTVRLFTTAQRVKALQESGIDVVIVQKFDREFANQSVSEFLEKYLVGQLGAKAVIVGTDFRFARDRSGNIDDIKNYGAHLGMTVDGISPVVLDGHPVRSSTIRRLLTETGDIQKANFLLGHSFILEGTVVKGDQRGRTIGFPTMNILCEQQILPKNGVYCGRVVVQDSSKEWPPSVLAVPDYTLPCVINLGTRPTFNGLQRRLEVHAYDTLLPMDSLYGQPIALYFESQIRDERKFETIDELKCAISDDIRSARKLISSTSGHG